MNETKTISEREAYLLAEDLHEGQTDKSGKPYIDHCLAVKDNLSLGQKVFLREERLVSFDERIVALLHDTVEDTQASLDLLGARGCSSAQIEAIDAITRRENEKYSDYIRRVEQNPIAKAVKIADLKHNLDPARKLPGSKGVGLRKRHSRALAYLEAGYDTL